MGSAWHRGIRGADWQVYIWLSRLSIHRLGLWTKHKQTHVINAERWRTCKTALSTFKNKKEYSLRHCHNLTVLKIHMLNLTSTLMKKNPQLFKTTHRQSIITHAQTHTHTRHTVSWAGRSNRKATQCCRLGRNVRLDQLIWFIFTWLQANSARLSRRLDLTFFGSCAFKKGKNDWFKHNFILLSSHLMFYCFMTDRETHTNMLHMLTANNTQIMGVLTCLWVNWFTDNLPYTYTQWSGLMADHYISDLGVVGAVSPL